MYPTLFEIPGTGFPIRAFGVMVVIGFLLGARVLTRLGERYAVEPEKEMAGYAAIPVWTLIGVLIGARMMYVIVEVLQGSAVGKEYIANLFKVFAYWEGGLVMYGGLLGGVAFGVWCAKRHGLRVLLGRRALLPPAGHHARPPLRTGGRYGRLPGARTGARGPGDRGCCAGAGSAGSLGTIFKVSFVDPHHRVCHAFSSATKQV